MRSFCGLVLSLGFVGFPVAGSRIWGSGFGAESLGLQGLGLGVRTCLRMHP